MRLVMRCREHIYGSEAWMNLGGGSSKLFVERPGNISAGQLQAVAYQWLARWRNTR